MRRGAFIVLEGVDGAGKSTLLGRLQARVEAALPRRVVRTAEPTRGPIGAEIRRRAVEGPPMAPREELELFLADRREHVAGVIAPALARGDVVLQDRYYLSTAAYQAARPALGLTPDAVVALHAWAPRPDLVVLLDLPVERGLARVAGRGRGDAFEERALQEAVRANFLQLAAGDSSFVVLDATAAPEALEEAAWGRVGPLVARLAPA